MRALLVVNPKATTTSQRGRDVLARALGSEVKLDVTETARRGHAIELGAQAVAEAYDLVVVLGGDGTVNEVVNGLMREVDARGTDRADRPALAVVPGGATNVFHRALDVPRDPVEAIGWLLDAIRERHSRWIGLGRVDERWFTFTAGLGLDADAVRIVEQARARGRSAAPSRYAWAAVRRFYAGDRRAPALTLERPGHDPVSGLFLAIVSNSSPWTYFGNRPVVLTPNAAFERGLDVAAMRRLRTVGTVWAAAGMLGGTGIRGRASMVLEDLTRFSISADRPVHLQVDGDYLGERETARFEAVSEAIRVIG